MQKYHKQLLLQNQIQLITHIHLMKGNHILKVNYKLFIILIIVILNAISNDHHTLLLYLVLRFQKLLFNYH